MAWPAPSLARISHDAATENLLQVIGAVKEATKTEDPGE